MRQVLSVLLFLFILFSINASAYAARFTGNYLLEMCASDEKGDEIIEGGHAICQSYISGVIDYNNLIRSLGTAPSVDFCVPDNVTLKELQSIVTAYIFRNKDQHGSFIASPAVAMALYAVYPCKAH